MKRFLFFLLLSSTMCEYAHSQDFILLSRPGLKKKIKYYLGDEITFMVKGENVFHTEVILQLKKDSVFFTHNAINIDSVTKVDIRRLSKPDILGYASIAAGVGYLFVDQFNHTVVKQRGWNVNGTVLSTSAILVGTGILIRKLKRRYFRVNKNNRITIVTF